MPKPDNNIKEDGYKMSMAEFKGQTLQALLDVRRSIDLLEKKQSELNSEINNQRLLAAAMGGVSGLLVHLMTSKGMM